MKIGICSDHAGYVYKTELISYLLHKGFEVYNFGTDSTESMDYPDVAHPIAKAIEVGDIDLGIALCGTGNGMVMTLNKHKGVRAALAWNQDTARLAKEHNNANMIAIPARFVTYTMARLIVKDWLEAKFLGGRHQRRIDKI